VPLTETGGYWIARSSRAVTVKRIEYEKHNTSDRQRLRLRGLDLDEFLAGLGGNGIAGVAAVLNVKLDGFTNIPQRLGAIFTLTDTSGQCRLAT
jgi:hypothetical protein